MKKQNRRGRNEGHDDREAHGSGTESCTHCGHRPGVDAKLCEILDALRTLNERGIKMDADIERLLEAVRKNTDIDKSIRAFLVGIKKKLDDAIANAGSLSAEDRAKLNASTADLDASSEEVSSAITENTPAEPTP